MEGAVSAVRGVVVPLLAVDQMGTQEVSAVKVVQCACGYGPGKWERGNRGSSGRRGRP